MTTKRTFKEYGMDKIGGVSLKFGSVNRIEPHVVYLIGKTWVKPTREHDYGETLSLVKKNLEDRLKRTLSYTKDFENKYILDFSLTPINMIVGKAKFLQFQIFLRQNRKDVKGLEKVKEALDENLRPIIRAMVIDFEDNNYNLSDRKKT